MRLKENEEAVSPVIGVILMVAITVILAAVIAAFVFGMTGGVEATKTVSIQSKLSGNNITLTIGGGADLATLQSMSISVTDSANDDQLNGIIGIESSKITGPTSEPGVFEVAGPFTVGQTITLQSDGPATVPLRGRLLVVGTWQDGADQIIIDRTY